MKLYIGYITSPIRENSKDHELVSYSDIRVNYGDNILLNYEPTKQVKRDKFYILHENSASYSDIIRIGVKIKNYA